MITTNYKPNVGLISLSVALAFLLQMGACSDEPALLTVTFNSSGGSAVEAQKVKNGSKATTPTEPTHPTAGMLLGGWFTDDKYTAAFDFNKPVTTNITLYAKWLSWHVSTIAGLAGTSGSADGIGSVARFNNPSGITVDGTGKLYIADGGNKTIRQLSPKSDGTYEASTIGGQAGISDNIDGVGSVARFVTPFGITIDGNSNLYVVQFSIYPAIRKLSRRSDGTYEVSTIANYNNLSYLMLPTGIAIDANGNLYVANYANQNIYKLSPQSGGTYTPTNIVGKIGNPGFIDGIGEAARFNYPSHIAIENSTGKLYVIDENNFSIRILSPQAGSYAVSTIPNISFAKNGTASGLSAIAIDVKGTIYITDYYGYTIRQLKPKGDGTYTSVTIAGLSGTSGSADDAIGTNARFNNPTGIAIDGVGAIYVTEYTNNTVRKIVLK